MQPATLVALAEPTRLRILSRLRTAERSVNELVNTLRLPQPAISKHLKVLREAGFVSRRVDGPQRLYRLEPRRFQELDAWLAPYRRLWTKHLDALERHLDNEE